MSVTLENVECALSSTFPSAYYCTGQVIYAQYLPSSLEVMNLRNFQILIQKKTSEICCLNMFLPQDKLWDLVLLFGVQLRVVTAMLFGNYVS